MKIVSKIDDRHYVVEIDDPKKVDIKSVSVAHDYVQFTSVTSIPSDVPIGCHHGSHIFYSKMQINIRDFIKVFKPILDNHEYCQPEHLIHDSDGNPAYTYQHSYIKVYNQELKCWEYLVRFAGEAEYSKLTQKAFKRLVLKEDD